MSDAFNPLGIENLGQTVLRAMLEREAKPLGSIKLFMGAGIYAIYYTGLNPTYEIISELNQNEKFDQPIYVGKAVPAGGRKGVQVATTTQTQQLSKRIREHSKSIDAAENLYLSDFHVRWLVVEPIWIPLGESLLIAQSAPVWNTIVDGFGNHDPGKGRVSGIRSRWDTIHPGRVFAHKYPERSESAADIARDATQYLNQRYDRDRMAHRPRLGPDDSIGRKNHFDQLLLEGIDDE
jgi:hypothetical protein